MSGEPKKTPVVYDFKMMQAMSMQPTQITTLNIITQKQNTINIKYKEGENLPFYCTIH